MEYKLSSDRRGQVTVTTIVVSTIVSLILLTVYFTVYNGMNLSALDTTSQLVVGFFGVFITVVILLGIVKYLS